MDWPRYVVPGLLFVSVAAQTATCVFLIYGVVVAFHKGGFW